MTEILCRNILMFASFPPKVSYHVQFFHWLLWFDIRHYPSSNQSTPCLQNKTALSAKTLQQKGKVDNRKKHFQFWTRSAWTHIMCQPKYNRIILFVCLRSTEQYFTLCPNNHEIIFTFTEGYDLLFWNNAKPTIPARKWVGNDQCQLL